MKCKLLIMLYSLVKLVKFSFSMLPDVVFLVNKDYHIGDQDKRKQWGNK